MSVPATSLRAEPSYAPGAPSTPRPSKAPSASRRPARRAAATRRRRALGFLILSSILVGTMILGLTALSALLAQSSFHVDDLENRIAALSQDNVELTRLQAALSAPGRIAAWARSHGMRLPDDVRFLHVPAAGSTGPAGAADAPASGAGAGA